MSADTVIVLDFETTGLSASGGDRAIEIGAVKIKRGKVVDRFQSLMNPGRRINAFIADYTGITNAMLSDAPPCNDVMDEFADFVENFDLVAHNASFDQRFLDAELARIERSYRGKFSCSMLVARRIYQHAPDHKLGTLVRYKNLPTDGTFHRALADAEMTTYLWLGMLDDIADKFNISDIPFSLMQNIARKPKSAVNEFMHSWANARATRLSTSAV